MICLSLYDNKDVQCYRSLLYFLIEEKLFINWCLTAKFSGMRNVHTMYDMAERN